MRKIIVSAVLISVLASMGIGVADVLPAHRISFSTILLTIFLLNYAWNFLIMALAFKVAKIGIDRRYPLYILSITLLGLIVDWISYVSLLGVNSHFGFVLWILFTATGLFIVAFVVAKALFKADVRSSTIVGLVYSIASNPVIGLFVLHIVLYLF